MTLNNYEPMAEIDANAASASLGIIVKSTTVADAAYSAAGKPLFTAGIHANSDATLYVKDRYGNVSVKEVLKGVTYVGAYVAIWLTTDGESHAVGEIQTVPDAGTLNLIF